MFGDVAIAARREDDNLWPKADTFGRQELEVVSGSEHISFVVRACSTIVVYSSVLSSNLDRTTACVRAPDLKDRFACRRRGQQGPRGSQDLLLSRARPQGHDLFAHQLAFQGTVAA